MASIRISDNKISQGFVYERVPHITLKAFLKNDIDEEEWEAVSKTVSRPFPRPASGQIAVKVINHFGDEVMKVFEVG